MQSSQQFDLDTLLVLPVPSHPNQVKRNYAKLWQAENMKDPVLIAALLPPAVIDQNGEEMIDLKTTLGVPIKIYPRVLNRALMKFTNAASRWRHGGDVLMLALASADRFTPDNQQPRVIATVRHMSLLPVTSVLTPLPTPILERVFNQRQASGEGWATGPQDDGLLAQWAGK